MNREKHDKMRTFLISKHFLNNRWEEQLFSNQVSRHLNNKLRKGVSLTKRPLVKLYDMDFINKMDL